MKKSLTIFAFSIFIFQLSSCEKISAPYLSFNEYQIIFDVAPQYIYCLNDNGSNIHELPIRGTFPKCSPDGKYICFYSLDGKLKNNIPLYSLCVYNFDKDSVWILSETVPKSSGHIDLGFDWSFDSKRIVFQSSKDGYHNIYVINADGTDEIKLTSQNYNLLPKFSADGTVISYSSILNNKLITMIMNDDGSKKHIFVDNENSTNPIWSPDGNKIAFCLRDSIFFDIYMVDENETNLVRLTSDRCSYPLAWSPSENRIIFSKIKNELNTFYTMNPDGSDIKRITKPGIYPNNIWVSPDGQKIAFTTFPEKNKPTEFPIYLINIDGTGKRNLGIKIRFNLSWRSLDLAPK